jgi:hypothetical protein
LAGPKPKTAESGHAIDRGLLGRMQTTAYAGFCKKLGFVQKATTKQGKAKTANAFIAVQPLNNNNEPVFHPDPVLQSRYGLKRPASQFVRGKL